MKKLNFRKSQEIYQISFENCICHRNGTVIQNFLTVLKQQKILGNTCFEQIFYRKQSLSAPGNQLFLLYQLRMKGKHYTVGWYLQQKLYLHFYNYDDILILLFFFFNYNDKTTKEQIDLSFPLSWTANSSCRLVQGAGIYRRCTTKLIKTQTVRTAGTRN